MQPSIGSIVHLAVDLMTQRSIPSLRSFIFDQEFDENREGQNRRNPSDAEIGVESSRVHILGIYRILCRGIVCTSRSVSASDAYNGVDQRLGDVSSPSVAEP
jgi:hypothetical protein